MTLVNDKTWTNQDLKNYITRFKDEQREYVLNTILEADLLRNFLNTIGGRLIINSAVDSINSQITNMLNLCLQPPEKVREEIMRSALIVNVTYDFIRRMAVIADQAEEHEKAMAK